MTDNDLQDGINDQSRRSVLLALALRRLHHDNGCPTPEDIVAWHDQTLSAADADAVQAHVAHCEDCYSLWTGLLRTETPAAKTPVRQSWWRRLLGSRPADPRREGRRLAPVFAGALAAGLAVIAVMNVTQFGGPGLPPIPGYELEFQGRAVVRGDIDPAGAGPVALQPGNRFSVVLRPDTTLDDPVEAQAFILVDGQLELLDAPPPQRLDYGVVVFEGRVGQDVILPDGASTLIFVSGRAGALPAPRELIRRLTRDSRFREDDWVAWRVEVVLE